MKISMNVDKKEFEAAVGRLGSQMQGVVVSAAKAGGKVIETEADAKAPGPHIEMKVTAQNRGSAEVSIGPEKEHWYYKFHEFGASNHQINARGGGRLAFQGQRGPVLTKSVSHPGMAAKPFLRPAITRGRKKAVEAAGAVFKAAMRK